MNARFIITLVAVTASRAVAAPPAKYRIDLPVATRLVPPVRSTFVEVTKTVERINGKAFRHPLNGGYGYRLKNPVTKKTMLHVGADLGWYRVGEPVYAVADGVVRISRPGLLARAKAAGVTPKLPPGAMLWGNFLAIEHRLKNGAYVTTFYGHLADKRLVNAGDVVKAGQQIGSIGRQSRAINGGYKPHLHFGVAYGRKLEKGRTLTTLRIGATVIPVNVVDFTNEWIELDLGPAKSRAAGLKFSSGGQTWLVEQRNGKHVLPAAIMWSLETPAFQLIGYSNSKEGYLDPVKFLRNPRLAKPGKKSGNDIEKPFELKVFAVLGKPAPAWKIDDWANLPAGKKTLEPSDYKGKIVVLFCFRANSPECRKFGYPTWKKLLVRYESDDTVRFVAIQTVDRDFAQNSFKRAKIIAGSFGRKIPLGQDGSAKRKSQLMSAYGVNNVPWMIVIDPQGKVRVNVEMPSAENCARWIELVRRRTSGQTSK